MPSSTGTVCEMAGGAGPSSLNTAVKATVAGTINHGCEVAGGGQSIGTDALPHDTTGAGTIFHDAITLCGGTSCVRVPKLVPNPRIRPELLLAVSRTLVRRSRALDRFVADG